MAMKFVKYLGKAHLNGFNVAIYQNGNQIKASAESARGGRSLGMRNFESMEALEDWFEGIRGSELGQLAQALERIAPDKFAFDYDE